MNAAERLVFGPPLGAGEAWKLQQRYPITVTNATTAGPTTGPVIVTDTLPSGLTFVAGSGSGWTCSATGQDVACTNPGPHARLLLTLPDKK